VEKVDVIGDETLDAPDELRECAAPELLRVDEVEFDGIVYSS
jgi:hypothetical protein